MDDRSPRLSTETKTFSGRFENLAKITDFVIRAARSAGLDQAALYAVEMAVDEACANIIQHAYGGEGKGDIECTCQIGADELTVTLRDDGSPFDPSGVPEPDVNAPLEERDEGGLGLYLIRKVMDEVHFEFSTDSGNTLTLVKRKETAS